MWRKERDDQKVSVVGDARGKRSREVNGNLLTDANDVTGGGAQMFSRSAVNHDSFSALPLLLGEGGRASGSWL